MTLLICGSTSESITLLGEPIANSGEGTVWRTNHGHLAKIYHSPTPERVQKLAVMIAHPPTEPNSHLNHISFAWPKSVLKNTQGDCVGFLMPEIKNAKEILDVYNPQRRKREKLEIDLRFLHITARNLASIIASLHGNGYVLGDIKPQNILVNNRALPSIIDTDSFQIRNPKNGNIYRCPVGSQDYTPPELIGKDFSSIDQTEVHDRFRLAIIIYQLLFGGQTPFGGKWIGAGETPEMNELILQGLWLYAPNSLFQPVEITIPLEMVHPEVKRCFLKCFNDGHQNPHLRPTAREWLEALKVASNELTLCGIVNSHYYSRTYGKCYWCDRAIKLGIDIFPRFSRPKQQSTFAESISQYQAFAAKNTSSSFLATQSQVSQTNQSANSLSPNNHSKQGILQGGVAQSNSSSANSLPIKTKTNNINQNFYAQENIQNNAQNMICVVLASKTIVSCIFFALISVFFYSDNSDYPKSKQHEFTNHELLEIANSEIKSYLIGIGIEFNINEQNKIITINYVFENTPAFRAGIMSGDEILAVDGISILNMSAKDISNLLKGEESTVVTLRINRPGSSEFNVALVRQKIINHTIDQSYIKRCFARYKLEDYRNALDDCNEGVRINSNNDEAYFLRGAVHSKLGNTYEAIEDIRKAASLGNEKAQEILKELD